MGGKWSGKALLPYNCPAATPNSLDITFLSGPSNQPATKPSDDYFLSFIPDAIVFHVGIRPVGIPKAVNYTWAEKRVYSSPQSSATAHRAAHRVTRNPVTVIIITTACSMYSNALIHTHTRHTFALLCVFFTQPTDLSHVIETHHFTVSPFPLRCVLQIHGCFRRCTSFHFRWLENIQRNISLCGCVCLVCRAHTLSQGVVRPLQHTYIYSVLGLPFQARGLKTYTHH